jgi:hypothetical protein
VAQLDLDNEAQELHKEWAEDIRAERMKKTEASLRSSLKCPKLKTVQKNFCLKKLILKGAQSLFLI